MRNKYKTDYQKLNKGIRSFLEKEATKLNKKMLNEALKAGLTENMYINFLIPYLKIAVFRKGEYKKLLLCRTISKKYKSVKE